MTIILNQDTSSFTFNTNNFRRLRAFVREPQKTHQYYIIISKTIFIRILTLYSNFSSCKYSLTEEHDNIKTFHLQFKCFSWLPSVEYFSQIKESLGNRYLVCLRIFHYITQILYGETIKHFLLILTIYLFTDDTNTNISVI